MITYEQAKKIALKANPKVNSVVEYDKGYVFSPTKEQSYNDAGIVVLKRSGEIRTFIQFITQSHPDPESMKNIEF